MTFIIKNAKIVLKNEIVNGSVKVRNGVIESVDQGGCSVPGAIDFCGDYLLPGFVELHTDNLEKELEPRPGVFWPDPFSSVLAHDAQMVSSGITTVLDAISLGEYHDGPKRTKIMDMSIHALRKARGTGVLKADHKFHLRCEYSDPNVLKMITPHVDDEVLMLVSLMDHTPGQRQFSDTTYYRNYYKKGWTDEEFAEISDDLISKQQKYAADNRQAIVSLCHERNIPIASHDDTISEHIEQAVLEQIAISEFPTTKLAASLARKAGLNIVMGGPNVVRGGSHSGNVAAQDLAAEGLLDILSSDYVPGSLASGAFMLHKKLSIPLHETICMVSLNPAQAVGLFDRGEIYPGKRSDMLRVREVEDVPVVLQTWAVGVGDLLDIARKNAA